MEMLMVAQAELNGLVKFAEQNGLHLAAGEWANRPPSRRAVDETWSVLLSEARIGCMVAAGMTRVDAFSTVMKSVG